MHQARTAWPVATRVSHVVAYEHLRKQPPTLSPRAFCAAAVVRYATFTRWWRRFHTEGKHTLQDRTKRPKKHSPRALAGVELDTMRTAQHAVGLGAKRRHGHAPGSAPHSVERQFRRSGTEAGRSTDDQAPEAAASLAALRQRDTR